VAVLKDLLQPRLRQHGLDLVSLLYFVLFELTAPIVEIVGLVGLCATLALGVLNVEFATLFFLAAYGYGLLLTTATFLIEEYAYHR